MACLGLLLGLGLPPPAQADAGPDGPKVEKTSHAAGAKRPTRLSSPRIFEIINGPVTFLGHNTGEGRPRFGGGAWPLKRYHAFVAAWWLLLLAYLPRTWVPWAIGAFALLLRQFLRPAHLLMGVGYPELRAVHGSGYMLQTPYGPTWGGMVGPFHRLTSDPLMPSTLNPWFSALTVVLLWTAVRHVKDERTATASAVLLACMPLPIALGHTESMFVLCALLQVTALGAAFAPGRWAPWLAGLSAMMLCFLRPGQSVFAFVVIVALLKRKSWAPAALGTFGMVSTIGVLIARNMAQADPMKATGEFGKLARLADPRWIAGQGATMATLDPWITPAGIVLAAGVGAWAAWKTKERLALWWGAAFLAGAIPYLHLFRHTDIVRFHLPTQTWLVAIVALGLVWVKPRTSLALGLLIAASTWVARQPLGAAPFTWEQEHDAFLAALPTIPADARVRYEPHPRAKASRQQWLDLLKHGVFIPIAEGPVQDGEWVWVSRFGPDKETLNCALDAVAETEITVRDVGIEQFDFDRTTVGLYRAQRCEPTPVE